MTLCITWLLCEELRLQPQTYIQLQPSTAYYGKSVLHKKEQRNWNKRKGGNSFILSFFFGFRLKFIIIALLTKGICMPTLLSPESERIEEWVGIIEQYHVFFGKVCFVTPTSVFQKNYERTWRYFFKSCFYYGNQVHCNCFELQYAKN